MLNCFLREYSLIFIFLDEIHRFSLKNKQAIHLPETSINEFNRLNHFLEKMMNKAICDYNSLKEFSENASHELQTPLAIIQGKLELLMQSPISDEQAGLILSSLNALDKLNKTNQSLILLTKLENQEYESIEEIWPDYPSREDFLFNEDEY